MFITIRELDRFGIIFFSGGMFFGLLAGALLWSPALSVFK